MVFVLLFAGSLLLTGLSGRRVLTRHEVLAAEPAREMLAGGNWVVPQFAGVPRRVKPPTTGWAIAASMALFQSTDEAVVRLPSAVAGIATALLIASLAARWFGRRAALTAGLMQATFYYILLQARLAEADMLLAASVCLAMWAFAVGNVEGPGGVARAPWLPGLFHAATGLSFLVKGVGPAFIWPACIAWVILQRRREAVRFLLDPAGLVILIVMLVGWPLAAWWRDPGIVQVWRTEVFGRFSGEMAQRQPFYYYAIWAPILLLPWLPFVAFGVIAGWRRGWLGRPIGQFIVCWFAPGFLILSCSAWKHPHYLIPMLPPMTFPAAVAMVGWLRDAARQRRSTQATGPTMGLVAIVTGTVIAATIVGLKVKVAAGATAALIAAAGLGAAATVAVLRSRWSTRAWIPAFATAWVVATGVQLFIIPRYDDYRVSADLARQVNAAVPAGETVYLMGLGEPHIAYYLRFPMKRIDRERDFEQQAFKQSAEIYALAPVSATAALEKIATLTKLGQLEHLRKSETEGDRTLFVRLSRRVTPPATQPD